MSDFEFYFSYYGLLLGLSVAAIIGGLARALNERQVRRIGVLTPLLALFMLLDITSFWLAAWDQKESLIVGWSALFAGLAVAGTYYLAASMVFPNRDNDWPSLEDHYWARKRWVVGGVLAINGAAIATAVIARPPAWNDWLFYVWQLTYFLPLTMLLFTRRRLLDIVLLSISIAFYLNAATTVFPESEWGRSTIL